MDDNTLLLMACCMHNQLCAYCRRRLNQRFPSWPGGYLVSRLSGSWCL